LRIRALALQLSVLALAALPGYSATVISRSGSATGFWLVGSGNNPAYASWNQPVGTAFSGVTVAVTISTASDGEPASGTAYITNAVGPGATAANVIAGPIAVGTSSGTPVSVPITFPSFNLPAGATYFLVLQQGNGLLQWNFSSTAVETVSAAPSVTSNVDGIGAAPASPAYNASFSAVGSPSRGLLFTVAGDPPTDLSITKTGPATANSGGTITYTTTVTNTTAGTTATGVSVADTTPANLTFVSNSGACATAFPCSLGSVVAGTPAVITSTYNISSSFAGSVSNTATVSSTTFDLNAANNSSTSTATVSGEDLSIVKSGPATGTPGATITYTVTVTNTSASGTATGVSVADTTPAGLTFVSNSGGCVTAYPCSLGSIAPSGVVTITSTYTIGSGVTGAVSNTATVSSTTADPNAANNSSTSTATVSGANLSITKTGPATASPNADMTYTIAVSNAGPSSATTTTVSDTLPAGLTFVSVTPSQGTCSGTTTVSCPLGTIASGGSASITLVVHTTSGSSGTTITNTATVSSAVTDPVPGNNSSTASTTVGATPIPALSYGGLGLLALLLGACGMWLYRREQYSS
jgi:large repetitive protein